MSMSIPAPAIVANMPTKRGSRPYEVGRRVKELREAAGLIQEQLAAAAGISQGTLSLLEKGNTKNPEALTILNIAAALHTSPYLLMFDNMPPPAMEHTMAAMIQTWNLLTERQRLQVIAYAQGLLDAGPPKPPPEHRPSPPPKSPPKPSPGSH